MTKLLIQKTATLSFTSLALLALPFNQQAFCMDSEIDESIKTIKTNNLSIKKALQETEEALSKIESRLSSKQESEESLGKLVAQNSTQSQEPLLVATDDRTPTIVAVPTQATDEKPPQAMLSSAPKAHGAVPKSIPTTPNKQPADEELFLASLNSRITKIEKHLFYDPFFEYSESMRVFSHRLTSRLSGYFGALHILGSGLIEHKQPSYLVVDIADNLVSCCPIPGVSAAFSSLVTLGKAAKGYIDEKKLEKLGYYTFSSFSEIDKASYLISSAIAGIYANQINLLVTTGAEALADSAWRTIEWYISKFQGTKITPDNLILAIGQYYVIPGEKKGLKGALAAIVKRQGINNPMAYCKKLSSRLDSVLHFYDRDIFLGSNLYVQDEKKYYRIVQKEARAPYILKHDGVNPLYTKVIQPSFIDDYGFRHVTPRYLGALKSYLEPEGSIEEIQGEDLKKFFSEPEETHVLKPAGEITLSED